MSPDRELCGRNRKTVFGWSGRRRFRARRIRAEQGSLGGRHYRHNKVPKGGGYMARTAQGNAGAANSTALIVLGWVAFFAGLLVSTTSPEVALSLQAVARVLP